MNPPTTTDTERLDFLTQHPDAVISSTRISGWISPLRMVKVSIGDQTASAPNIRLAIDLMISLKR
jgi:hypothetical protein